ncbi:Uptake hydrogenase large subunit [hydrothermal vent metagenome]|uniref:Uptake hydrogenase large subunit n=1 Tax=hydrothermal vent metagenome TaxID=652676 RepID=A0A1W1CMN5_9ZZZZ
MTIKKLIEQIEGEANLYFDIKDGVVDFATVAFPHFRGLESILKGKNIMDALVITPRVCGICGHAHLMATVRAIEDAYKNAGEAVVLNEKIEKIREFTLVMEIIQNHFKWIYLTIIPSLAKLSKSEDIQTPLKGAFGASLATKALAIFAGQWPHSSYMVPGGVTTDPTNIEILKAQSYVEELISFYEKEALGLSLEEFLNLESCKEFNTLEGDIRDLEKALVKEEMNKKGFSHDRFLVLGKHNYTAPSKLKQTRVFSVDAKYVEDVTTYSPKEKSYAKNAQYKNEYYETGPLSRMMAIGFPIVKNMHRRFKDSAYSRVMARVFELAYLLKHSKSLLESISIDQQSYVKTADINKLTATGRGVVEAPRGPLIHEIDIKDGIIQKYKIITPTQFNIGSSQKPSLTPAQKAMTGLTQEEALFVFRTFDVCSVCTTH